MVFGSIVGSDYLQHKPPVRVQFQAVRPQKPGYSAEKAAEKIHWKKNDPPAPAMQPPLWTLTRTARYVVSQCKAPDYYRFFIGERTRENDHVFSNDHGCKGWPLETTASQKGAKERQCTSFVVSSSRRAARVYSRWGTRADGTTVPGVVVDRPTYKAGTMVVFFL